MFRQTPPELGNQFDDDFTLRSYLKRVLPDDVRDEIEPDLQAMGELAGGELYDLCLEDRLNEPVLINWDAWGERVDRIQVTEVWRRAERIAAEHGLIATAYDQRHGPWSRVHQFALVYLFTPSNDMYSCPLAMTDGAARILIDSGNQELINRAVPHLTSRDPEQFWTAGQWMTELTGGSDVGVSETVAAQDEEGRWRLTGRKWFTSAITSQMALTLGRPVDNGPGGRGLALFYVNTRDEDGRPNHLRVERLKDKLGTRKLPTAELTLEETPAELVMEAANGVRNITPLLNITRLWNSVTAISYMRRGLALAEDYARKRVAFGATLAEKPLHAETLAEQEAEFMAAFHFTFAVVELMGRVEAGAGDETDAQLLRLLTPIVKLLTGKQAMAVVSEVIESFGGAGYVEDTGLPALLRDAQVLPIWEGTTNVLALDTLRALHKVGGLEVLADRMDALAAPIREPGLADAARSARVAVNHAERWLFEAMDLGQPAVERGARRFAITLGRAMEAALLAHHAQWSLDHEQDSRAWAAAMRFARHGVDQIVDGIPGEPKMG